MSNLLYSQANIDLEGLRQVATPPPQGRFHQPYPFAEYVDNVQEALDRVGFQIQDQEYELSPDRQAFFGALQIAPADDSPVLEGEYIPANEPDYSLLVGVRGSHDQRIPRGLVLGSRVMVCSNLHFSGNIGSFVSKQTKYLHRRLPGLINEVINHIPDLAEAQDRKFDAFKAFEFRNPRHGDAALVEIFRQGGLTASQLGKAVREWDKPSYEEHAQYGNSAWQLLNAVTESLKPNGERVNHNLIAQRTAVADRFLSNVVGIQDLAA